MAAELTLAQTVIAMDKNQAVLEAAMAMLAERDRMVESGQYNDLSGVSHRLRFALRENGKEARLNSITNAYKAVVE